MAIRAFGPSTGLGKVAERLDGREGVSFVSATEATRTGHAVLSAVVRPRAVETVLGDLRQAGVAPEDVTVTRMDVVKWTVDKPTESSLSWADVLGEAWLVSKPVPRYLAYMVVAGVIACYGVTDRNVILIVGAMAISPDLLPTMATGVGIAVRRWRLVAQGALTFALGMATACASAALFAFAMNQLNALPAGFTLASASAALGGLTHVNNETIAVAFTAGVAGMLSLETQASSAVGVAVSVTTIPAAAYLGVAAGTGDAAGALGAFAVLNVNFAMMTLGALGTLSVQWGLRRRRQSGDRGPLS
ncbi:MAG: DUF389 domain-containing protein [Actinobacteria bacterium]|nr:DUF389 domain-containing protein [Actinomycetota bacterium]